MFAKWLMLFLLTFLAGATFNIAMSVQLKIIAEISLFSGVLFFLFKIFAHVNTKHYAIKKSYTLAEFREIIDNNRKELDKDIVIQNDIGPDVNLSFQKAEQEAAVPSQTGQMQDKQKTDTAIDKISEITDMDTKPTPIIPIADDNTDSNKKGDKVDGLNDNINKDNKDNDKNVVVKPKFNVQKLNDIFDKYIVNYIKFWDKKMMLVAINIMKLLDENKNMPSIVNIIKPDAGQQLEEIVILKKVTLLEHSVHVVENMMAEFSKPDDVTNIRLPKYFITGLAHDLGKIKGYQNVQNKTGYYSTGDHGRYSVDMLMSIEGFDKLDIKDEIIKAVMEHHKYSRKKVKFINEKELMPLSISLINADSKARDDEIQQGLPELSHFQAVMKDKQRRLLDWLDEKQFLEIIKSKINVVENSKFFVFSMADGTVYVLTNYLKYMLYEVAEQNNQNDIMDIIRINNKNLNQKILTELILLLNNDIDKGKMNIKYFNKQFIIKFKDGSEVTKWMVPFKASVFTDDVAGLEDGKPEKIRDIVSVVEAELVDAN